MQKKIKRKTGDIIKIILKDGDFCFGRVLKEPLIAFYDIKINVIPAIEELINLPILFKIWVMNYAITSGRWEVVGSCALDDELIQSVSFFKQDPINKKFYLYIDSEEIPATRDECQGLERAAVWDPEHVEDRLLDYYLGMPNKWVESLKIK